MDRNALVVNGLTKRYQDFTLDGVSFTVPQGSIVGLIGENGAGKSTTLHAVLGLIGRDGGTVELLGLPDIQQPFAVGRVADDAAIRRGL